MKKYTLICALLLSACGNEQQAIPIPKPADAYVAACTKRVQHELDSGSTSRMRAAAAQINTCLEKKFIEASVSRLNGSQSTVIIEKSLPLLRTGYQRIQWEMAINDANCSPNCGTMAQMDHLTAYQLLLENLLNQLLAIPVPVK